VKRLAASAVLAAAALPAPAQDAEIQRALIQRDQQSAEFAARVHGQDTRRLEQLNSRQLIEAVRPVQPEPPSYQRQKMADERLLVLPPPLIRERPVPQREPRPLLALPGGTSPLVDPIPAQGPGY
jgi:hypothetical protein